MKPLQNAPPGWYLFRFGPDSMTEAGRWDGKQFTPSGATDPLLPSELAGCQDFRRMIPASDAEQKATLTEVIAGRPYKLVHSEKFGFWIIVEICDEDCPCSLTKAGEWSPVLDDTWPSREAAEDFLRSLTNG